MDIEKLKASFNKKDYFSREHNIRLLALSDTSSEAEMEIAPINCNFMGNPHGGLLFGLGDIAVGVIALTTGMRCVTLNGNINYLKMAVGKKVLAKAREVSRGNRLRVYDVDIYDERGTLICNCSFTMYITKVALDAEKMEK